MHLGDLAEGGVIRQDDWSLKGLTFGSRSQLQVVGWSGKCGSSKYYILKCQECSKDPELFGEGYFRSMKGDLLQGHLPCGCATARRWTKDQYITLCLRKARDVGVGFLGFSGDWSGKSTRVELECPIHGAWDTTNINNLLNFGTSCPECKFEMLANIATKPDSELIESFFNSGSFHPSTLFSRSKRLTKEGFKSYWYVECPDCGETGESRGADLQQGKRPCACSPSRQQTAYVHQVCDENGLVVALKFGIALNPKRRMVEQTRKSIYNLQEYKIYDFPTVHSCKKAERECKQNLKCGVLSKDEMGDGYTETAPTNQEQEIIQIFEKNGGNLRGEIQT